MVIRNTNTKKRVIHYENFNESIEKFYYTLINILENSLGYENIDKIDESFTASVNSAQWGLMEQRKSIQQDKLSGYLATIGKLIKDMILIYKEIKIMDERIAFYEKTGFKFENSKFIIDENYDLKLAEPAEKQLKDLWISLVEGGGQNATSVYGLAQTVGFVTLPDLFFKLNSKNEKEINNDVDKLEVNTQLKGVLKRKLQQYILWKERTYVELKTRREFDKNYLRQHFNVIKLYYSWTKPYIDNLKKLNQSSRESKLDLSNPSKAYQLLETSESLISDVKIRCIKKSNYTGNDGSIRRYQIFHPVIDVNIHYRTRPVLAYEGQDRNRGAIQLGRIELEFTHSNKSYKDLELEEFNENQNILNELASSIDTTLTSINSKDFLDLINETTEDIIEEKSKKNNYLSGLKEFIPFYPKLKNKKLDDKNSNKKFNRKYQLGLFNSDLYSNMTLHEKIGSLIMDVYKDKKLPSTKDKRSFIKEIKNKIKIHQNDTIEYYIYEEGKSKADAENDFNNFYELIKIAYSFIRSE